MVADAVLVDLPEEVAQRLLAQAPGAARGQLGAAPVLLDQPRIGQRLGQFGQPVQGPGRILTHVGPDLVEIDLAEGGRRRRRLQQILHAVELTQLGGQIGGAGQAQRAFAVEPVGALPAGIGHRPL